LQVNVLGHEVIYAGIEVFAGCVSDSGPVAARLAGGGGFANADAGKPDCYEGLKCLQALCLAQVP